jgi:hypothetical protein
MMKSIQRSFSLPYYWSVLSGRNQECIFTKVKYVTVARGATAAPVVDRWLQLPPDLFSRVSPAGNQLAAIIFYLHRRLT